MIITLKDGTRYKVNDKEVEEALQLYQGIHWGHEPQKIEVHEDIEIPSVVVNLGILRAVLYQTSKKGDDNESLYWHTFKLPFPNLCVIPGSNKLVIVGGGYTVKNKGIVG